MRQTINGIPMEVVTFNTMPAMPITGLTEYEEVYEKSLSKARGFTHETLDPNYPRTGLYAKALTHAIESGVITEPGKYGIYIDQETKIYKIAKIIEE